MNTPFRKTLCILFLLLFQCTATLYSRLFAYHYGLSRVRPQIWNQTRRPQQAKALAVVTLWNFGDQLAYSFYCPAVSWLFLLFFSSKVRIRHRAVPWHQTVLFQTLPELFFCTSYSKTAAVMQSLRELLWYIPGLHIIDHLHFKLNCA